MMILDLERISEITYKPENKEDDILAIQEFNGQPWICIN